MDTNNATNESKNPKAKNTVRRNKQVVSEKGTTMPSAVKVAGRKVRQAHDLSGPELGGEGYRPEGSEAEAAHNESRMGLSGRSQNRTYPVVGNESVHTGLVFQEAQRWAWSVGPGLDMDDIVSAGHMGIVRALQTWDSERCKFSAYALPWVRHFIRRTISKSRLVHIPQERINAARSNGENLPYMVYSDETDDEDNACNVLQTPDLDMEDLVDVNTQKGLLIKALAKLSKTLRDVVTMRDYKEMHFTEIGAALGVSSTRAKQLYNEAISKLRNSMSGAQDVN